MSRPLDMQALQPPGATEELARRMGEDLRAYWAPDEGLDDQKVHRVDCSLCGAACPDAVWFTRERFPYRRCPGCGLVYPSPRPRSSFIKSQYETGRFAEAFETLYLPSAAYRMATIFTERVDEIIRPRVPSGRLLDVGCGPGHFLRVAADRGYETYGVEPSPQMVAFATERLGLARVTGAALADAGYPPDFFDVVTVWEVLEHVERPGDILRDIFRVVKPGGWVFAYTENIESFNAFVTGPYAEMIAPDVHLRHYSPATFRLEFERAGFAVDQVYTRGLDLSHISKTVAAYPHAVPLGVPELSPESCLELQEWINHLGKGDNLRLYARRPAR